MSTKVADDDAAAAIKEESSSSFLEAAQQAEETPDVENQNQPQRPLPTTNHSIGILAPHKSHHTNKEQDDDGDSSTDSLFSFDSYELKGYKNKFQSVTTTGAATVGSSGIPFPSVVAAEGTTTIVPQLTRNICPCQCLFFTVKETICLVMSALGCAVFLAGLVVLCLYLEGSLFEGETDWYMSVYIATK